MSFTTKQILVTGASGNLGRAVVGELRRHGAKNIIAGTRSPGKNRELAALGVEERGVDFDRPESLDKAFAGVDRLLLVSTDSLHTPGLRIRQHRAAIKAAVNAGVEHIAYTSLPNAHPTEIPSVPDDHFWTEVALFNSGLDWTILRNNLYAEVILRFAQFALKTGKLTAAIGSQGRSYVSRQDCARVAAAALVECSGKAIYDVTGPTSVTHEGVAGLLSRFSGRAIQYVDVEPEEVERGLVAAGVPQFAARSLRGLDEEAARGYHAIISPAVKDLTGQEPMSLEGFLHLAIPSMIAQPAA